MELFHLGIPLWQFLVRAIVIDIVLIVMLRLFGKRELGQFTLYDLVLVLLVANAVQPAITGPDSSLLGGLIIIAILVAFNWALGRLDRYRFFHRLLAPDPRILIKDGHFVENALRAEDVDRDQVEMAIREHGIDDEHGVKLGVLESDGTISIVPKEASLLRSHRRVRYMRRA